MPVEEVEGWVTGLDWIGMRNELVRQAGLRVRQQIVAQYADAWPQVVSRVAELNKQLLAHIERVGTQELTANDVKDLSQALHEAVAAITLVIKPETIHE